MFGLQRMQNSMVNATQETSDLSGFGPSIVDRVTVLCPAGVSLYVGLIMKCRTIIVLLFPSPGALPSFI
jgi:hypothetical protein